MMNWMAEEIKRSVPIQEAMALYGMAPNKNGFVRCPFHEEDTPSLRLYPQTNTFYCFGCGTGGDVIALVKRLFDCGYTDALSRLNDDFGLGLFQRRSRQRETAVALRAQQERQAYERWQRQLYRDHYRSVADWYYRLTHEPMTEHRLALLHQIARLEAWLDEFLVYDRWKEIYGCQVQKQ